MLRPRKRRAPLRPIILSLILIGVLGWSFRSMQSCQSQQARSRIEQSLGAPSDHAMPAPELGNTAPPELLDDPEREPMAALPTPGIPNPFGGGSFPSPSDGLSPDGVQMEETPKAYRLRVPLADRKDASQVQLKVTSHHIEISGQTGSAPKPGSPGFAMTTSFMQSLDTSQEVLPQKVRREVTEQDGHLTLLITIPKRYPGIPQGGNFKHPKTDAIPLQEHPMPHASGTPSGHIPDNVF